MIQHADHGGQAARTWANLWPQLGQMLPPAMLRNVLQEGQQRDAPPGVPSAVELEAICEEAEAKMTQLRAQVRSSALDAWRRRMRTTQVYPWIRGSVQPADRVVDVAAPGAPADRTADVVRIDDAVRTYWAQIGREAPRWREGEDMLLEATPAGTELDRDERELNENDLWEALRGASGCAGPCGWTPAMLRGARPMLASLARLFRIMEIGGVLPHVFRCGDVSMIPKSSAAASFRDLRPITVMAATYRLYSSARLKASLFAWQERVMGHLPFFGCRPGRGPIDATWPIHVSVEATRQQGGVVHGAGWDLAKAFDSLPVAAMGSVLWKILGKRNGDYLC